MILLCPVALKFRVNEFRIILLSFCSSRCCLGDPDILYWWRHWYNVSDLIDEQGELFTLEAYGAEELARMEEEAEK
jgi:hypothetical protein